MRAIDWRTSSSRSANASAAHSGLIPVSSCDLLAEVVVGEGEHAAVGVVDEDDLLGAEQALRDRQRADLVVGDDAAGVADHVRVAFLRPSSPYGLRRASMQATTATFLAGRQRQLALVEAGGVALGVASRSSVTVTTVLLSENGMGCMTIQTEVRPADGRLPPPMPRAYPTIIDLVGSTRSCGSTASRGRARRRSWRSSSSLTRAGRTRTGSGSR